jgi:hypothetical protein
MLSGEFRTPNRAEVSSELSLFMTRSDFEEFMERAEHEKIPSDLAALALKRCNGDYAQAYTELHPGSDPAVNAWHASGVSLTGLAQQDTFKL